MGKYENLGRKLENVATKQVKLTFDEIEKILGFPLPPSAFKFRPWWANDKTHVQASDGWINNGWKVNTIDFNDKSVFFEKETNINREEHNIVPTVDAEEMNPYTFERLAREVMSQHFNQKLSPRKIKGIPKLFDLVSQDSSIIGDAKFLTMVKGTSIPPAKFATIAEYVWLLEKISANKKFLVFGNDKRVPEEWLKRYGSFLKEINFYFLDFKTKSLDKL